MLNLGSKHQCHGRLRYSPGSVKAVWLSYCPTVSLLKTYNYMSSLAHCGGWRSISAWIRIWKKDQLPSGNLLEGAGDYKVGVVHGYEICCKLAREMIFFLELFPVDVRFRYLVFSRAWAIVHCIINQKKLIFSIWSLINHSATIESKTRKGQTCVTPNLWASKEATMLPSL